MKSKSTIIEHNPLRIPSGMWELSAKLKVSKEQGREYEKLLNPEYSWGSNTFGPIFGFGTTKIRCLPLHVIGVSESRKLKLSEDDKYKERHLLIAVIERHYPLFYNRLIEIEKTTGFNVLDYVRTMKAYILSFSIPPTLIL